MLVLWRILRCFKLKVYLNFIDWKNIVVIDWVMWKKRGEKEEKIKMYFLNYSDWEVIEVEGIRVYRNCLF